MNERQKELVVLFVILATAVIAGYFWRGTIL